MPSSAPWKGGRPPQLPSTGSKRFTAGRPAGVKAAATNRIMKAREAEHATVYAQADQTIV
ncbi:hypothetical protein GCM10023334_084360 [Nonomuraea thailandensis]